MMGEICVKTKIIAVTMVLSTLATSAFTEQPNAQKYRDILQSGKFYVEYELDDVKKTLAVQDNKRMDYTIYKKTGNIGLAVGLSLINPFSTRTERLSPLSDSPPK